MSYTALYRKFRPLNFDEMVGQEHITRTLRNQIMAGRVGHAYLFNGGRGTGKTSAAKILARAINCLNPKEGEPCNECAICKATLSGSLTDIVEMDAASNNSVEDIRSIREEVNFLPTLAKYRVYIIDEVHMLSTGAFNALLKTLEEPPAHVKFILATTEPQKLPATILSRCQRFDFKKIGNDDISRRLQFVCKESSIEITEGALGLIAILSEGAMRDALSILERCIQEGTDHIDEEKIKDLVGIPKLESIYKIVSSILSYQVEDTIKAIDEVIEAGKDLNNLLWEIIKYVKDILVYKATNSLKIYSQIELNQIKELAELTSKERLLNIIYELSELENDMKWSSQKSILFQVKMIKLCSKQETKKLVETVDQNTNHVVHKQESLQNKEKQSAKPKANDTVNLSKGKGIDGWKDIVDGLKQSGKILLYTNLINSKAVEINDMTVGVEFPEGITSFGKSIIEKPENINELSKLISMQYGKEMRVKIIDHQKANHNENQIDPITGITDDLDIPINIIDE